MTTERLTVETPAGPAHAHVHRAVDPVATLLLGHGAGRGADTHDLVALADALPADGFNVIRVDQPWVVAGRRVAPASAALDLAWTAIVPQLRRQADGLLISGGRSAGARVACRTAAEVSADAVLAIAFPLHPPGRPDRSRAHELAMVATPLLIVQGSSDAFGRPEEFPAVPAMQVLEGADHSLRVRVRAVPDQQTISDELVATVRAWVRSLVGTVARKR